MSAAVLRRIALTLLIALGLWGALALLQRGRRDDPGRLVMSPLNLPTVERVVLARPNDTITLARDSGGWTANGFRADTMLVHEFLAALGDSSSRSELVAQSAASHARLGVDSAVGRHLVISAADQPVVDLWLGSRGPDFEGFYTRRAGQEAVYLLRGRFMEQTAKSVSDWRDKRVATVLPEQVARVEVTRGKTHWRLSRNGRVWQLDRTPADSTKVRRYLGHFEDLRALGFPQGAEGDSARFDPPDRTVTLFDSAGTRLLALAFDSTVSGFFWARAGAGAPIVRFDVRTVDATTPDAGALRP
jgi:hypothetical protein